MRTATEVSREKLRGGYYTPDVVVDLCMARTAELVGTTPAFSLLEPAAGDGAFVRGLARSSLGSQLGTVVCIEKDAAEAAKCQATIEECGFEGYAAARSFFDWAEGTREQYDCVLGNPPFVRYQFVPSEDRRVAERLLVGQDVSLAGVSNFCIPFVLVSLLRLRPGGAFAMVLPSEVLCTTSGVQVRSALLAGLDDLCIDLFPREAFPDILQDVVVFSGRKRLAPRQVGKVCFVEHGPIRNTSWAHTISISDGKWTRFLLDDHALRALEAASRLELIHNLGDVARFSVSIVTGANGFFTVDQQTMEEHELTAWGKPLMSRTSDSPGIIFRYSDQADSARKGRPVWLLDFGAEAPEPEHFLGAQRYLESGHVVGIPNRYKCRIRSPWYRVPGIWPGRLMMSKRANLHHRVILNEASVLTTDTVYRGSMRDSFRGRERDLVAGFHNSLTLLTAEMEGRSYGGGVLEVVPSEIARLLVPMACTNGHLTELDDLSRLYGGQRDKTEKLVSRTDELLSEQVRGLGGLLDVLGAARLRLRARRLNSGLPPH